MATLLCSISIFIGISLATATQSQGKCDWWLDSSDDFKENKIRIITQVDVPKTVRHGKLRFEYEFGHEYHCDTSSEPEPELPVFTDCSDIPHTDPKNSGIFKIKVGDHVVPVYCEIKADGSKFMIFQRRIDGTLDFYRTWDEYENGFGNASGEFWLGNKHLHRLTSEKSYKLRIELEAFDGLNAYAEYAQFVVGSNDTHYPISISGFSGNAGDSLTRHNGKPFTTKDSDNDDGPGSNCATVYKGGWWYDNCHMSNLNGLYHQGQLINIL